MYCNSPEREQQNTSNTTPLVGIDPAVFRQAAENTNNVLNIAMVNNDPMVILPNSNRNDPPSSETTQPELLTSIPIELRDHWIDLPNIDYNHLTAIPPAPEFDYSRQFTEEHRRIGRFIRERYSYLYNILTYFDIIEVEMLYMNNIVVYIFSFVVQVCWDKTSCDIMDETSIFCFCPKTFIA